MRILVMLARDDGLCRDAWSGVDQWRQDHGGVDLRIATGFPLPQRRAWWPDAVVEIRPFVHPDALEGLDGFGWRGPVASVTFWEPPGAKVQVGIGVDDDAIGPVALSHFRDFGYSQIAYLGLWSKQANTAARSRSLARAAHRAGVPFHGCLVDGHPDWSNIIEWIRQLPPHTGILLGDDNHGPWMHDIIHDAGREVPGDLALLGVGNDLVACTSTQPPLSSVILPAPAMGRAAIESLVLLVRSRPRRKRKPIIRRFAPLGVHVRPSSDLYAVTDRRLHAALQWIRTHLDQPIHIDELARHAHWNRRSMHAAFKASLGRTPLEHIHRMRIDAAQQLLREGATPTQAAERLGFKTLAHFSRLFKQQTGQSPRDYLRHCHVVPAKL